MEEKSGVYKLNCNDCDSEYIGQTGRNFKKHWDEHSRAWHNNKPENSNFANQILHVMNKSKKLNQLENLEIMKSKKNSNVINLNDDLLLDNELFSII